MGRRDRLNIMTSGIEVDADQPIIVHDYDNDRQVVLTAEDLIAYQHAGVRKFLQDIGTIAALATPLAPNRWGQGAAIRRSDREYGHADRG